MKGSRRWRRRVRAQSERYWRMYGYATEALLQRFRRARVQARLEDREAQGVIRSAPGDVGSSNRSGRDP
jgi:hypothetical protein